MTNSEAKATRIHVKNEYCAGPNCDCGYQEKATPRPWEAYFRIGKNGMTVCGPEQSKDIALFYETEADIEKYGASGNPDLRFALKAVNNHDALLEACRLARMEIENHIADNHHKKSFGENGWNPKTQLPEIAEVLRQAIANATK